jgi:anti-sigma factor RsiW
MSCKEIENSIWDYIEGSLDQVQANHTASHIKDCPHCASLEKGIRESLQLIEQAKKTEADPFFYSRLEARMEQDSRKQMPKRIYAVRYAMAASIAFLAIVGGGLFGSFSAEQLNGDIANQVNLEQMDDFGLELADNSFDLIKDFE